MPRIAYTVGEPAGIGPDIILQLAQESELLDIAVITDRRVLIARAERLGIALPSSLRVIDVPVADPSVCGAPSVVNVPGVINMLNVAIDGCLQGDFSAMVTGPLHKGIINDAGMAFSGHTEYLAERTGAPLPVMLLATSRLRVALITTHLPLKDVSAAITEQRIMQVCRIIDHDLRSKFGIAAPRQLICGLNPHAGEGGHLGMEEIEIIEPALARLRAEGLDVVGPLPADTLFTAKYLAKADIAVAMYHDQGLPVLKSQGFGEAANITLGLPIIRTSVDHGTAFDLAGSGQADTGSLMTAIAEARRMQHSRKLTENIQ
ncbi:4-hydroxythreonine-4-phosphate dehydrogenase PdxA [Arenicella xantha]|nr:4-hydroxythreonine-4-phosphate dehydrogenase PdxA [Arenicella xantha]